MNDLLSQPILYISTILFSIIAYIGKNLIEKLENLTKEIGLMDKNLGIIIERLKYTELETARLKERVDSNTKEISKVRDKQHEFGNMVSVYQLKILELENNKGK